MIRWRSGIGVVSDTRDRWIESLLTTTYEQGGQSEFPDIVGIIRYQAVKFFLFCRKMDVTNKGEPSEKQRNFPIYWNLLT